MGIDYDAKLIYGWTFCYDDIFPCIISLLKEEGKIDANAEDEDLLENIHGDYEIWEIFGQWLNTTHSDLCAGYASPYYDSGFDEATFYISFTNADDTETLRSLLNEHADDNNDNNLKLLERLNCKESLEVMALVHIW